MIPNQAIDDQSELEPLVVIGEAGLAFMERMIARGIFDAAEMERACFWRVKAGMLNGIFDLQIEKGSLGFVNLRRFEEDDSVQLVKNHPVVSWHFKNLKRLCKD